MKNLHGIWFVAMSTCHVVGPGAADESPCWAEGMSFDARGNRFFAQILDHEVEDRHEANQDR